MSLALRIETAADIHDAFRLAIAARAASAKKQIGAFESGIPIESRTIAEAKRKGGRISPTTYRVLIDYLCLTQTEVEAFNRKWTDYGLTRLSPTRNRKSTDFSILDQALQGRGFSLNDLTEIESLVRILRECLDARVGDADRVGGVTIGLEILRYLQSPLYPQCADLEDRIIAATSYLGFLADVQDNDELHHIVIATLRARPLYGIDPFLAIIYLTKQIYGQSGRKQGHC